MSTRMNRRKKERREQAIERQAAYDALTFGQKLAHARARILPSAHGTREVERLLAASERGTADHVLNAGGAG